jgi:UDP-N-acetyl-D-galactosamine dehydrogenase
MGRYVASQMVKAMLRKRIHIEGARVLVLGLTFKENCPDLRNSRVVDVIEELREFGVQIDVYDPLVPVEEARNEYGLIPILSPKNGTYDGIIIAVAHREFSRLGSAAIRAWGKAEHVLYDLKHVFSCNESDIRL